MRHLPLISGLLAITLSAAGRAASASPDSPGPCTAQLQRLGYSRVELDAVNDMTSIYEARRGRDEVKLMVKNGSCAVQQVWLDD
jgi:hypothetical protein